MGTSQSSNGSPSGVPMVPPWVPKLPVAIPVEINTIPPLDISPAESQPTAVGEPVAISPIGPERKPLLAPNSRFGSAKRSLGEYARTGDRESLRRGFGHYIKRGYGGSATATRRFAGTTQTANALFSALSGIGSQNPFSVPGGGLDPILLAGRTADEIMDAVIEAIRPVDGTQDAEASRAGIKDALCEVLTRFPNADLLNLDDQQRDLAIERFVAEDVFRRFDLDLGKSIRDKAPNYREGLSRLKEVREYIREVVSASFRNIRSSGRQVESGRLTDVLQSSLQDAFRVFEDYVK